jgi:hypothetical protein
MRKQVFKLAAAVAVVVAASSGALAQAQRYQGPVTVNPNFRYLIFQMSCVVSGTPTEFPDDIKIKNTGAAVIPAGMKIHWVIAAPHHEGNYTFAAPLGVGQQVFISHAFSGGAGAGTPCTTSIVK